MARVTEKGFSGAIGNYVFYTMNGKNYVRSKPGKRNKKQGAKVNPLNTVFGTISKYGSKMIMQMKDRFLFRFGRETYNNFRGWMRNLYAVHKDDAVWELSVKNSGMCRLNAAVDLRDLINTDITIEDCGNGKLKITLAEMIPRINIKAPLRTIKVNIKLVVVTSPFKDDVHQYNLCTEQYSFDYNNDPLPATSLEFNTSGGTGDIAVLAMALEYQTSDTGNGFMNKDLKWLPAAAIAMGRLK
ncbi:MAG: hypothetical protein JST81_00390 [Bacteroidetes bacterium]|nr:hypothetical protein [Bacteroidota bacterium]